MHGGCVHGGCGREYKYVVNTIIFICTVLQDPLKRAVGLYRCDE